MISTKYLDVIQAMVNNDLPEAESRLGLLNHHLDVQKIAQLNCLELIERTTNDYFFKFYVRNNLANKWEFFDYGFLKDNRFYGYKSKIMMFTIIDFDNQTRRLDDNKLVVASDNNSYLLLTPHSQVLDYLFINMGYY